MFGKLKIYGKMIALTVFNNNVLKANIKIGPNINTALFDKMTISLLKCIIRWTVE